MKFIATLCLLVLSGCASQQEIKTTTLQKEVAPNIWSGHKELTVSVESCASKGVSILESLGFKSVVKNGHYVYGNYKDHKNYSHNRAAIKCVSVANVTFVYAAVAGPKVELVETLRNEIIWQL